MKEVRPAAAGRPRHHEVDALRSTLMLLGVVIHASLAYSAHETWIVRGAGPHPAFDATVGIVHLFRMQAFFVVSGFFSAMLVARWSPGPFLRDRARRLGMPLLTTALTVNVLEFWLFHARGAAPADVPALLLAHVRGGGMIGQLWFLVDLLVFCVALAALAPLVSGAAAGRVAAWMRHPRAIEALLAAAVAGGVFPLVLSHFTGGVLDHYVLGLLHPTELLGYVPAFALGILLHAEPTALGRFARVGWGTLALAVGGLALALAFQHGDDPLSKALTRAGYVTLRWMTVRSLFALFRRYASAPSPTFTYLADASFTIYLLHHVVVASTVVALRPSGLPTPLQFAVVLAVGAGVPLAVHHFGVRRSPLLAFLLNGKRLGAAPRRLPGAGDVAVGVPYPGPGTTPAEPGRRPSGSMTPS